MEHTGVTNKIECENKGGTWIASGSKEVKFWGYGDICVKSCSEAPKQTVVSLFVKAVR